MSARALLPLCLCAGCAGRSATIADAFPPGSVADPWVLQQQVWSGTFARAAPALGPEADDWGRCNPARVWLALYRHQNRPQRRITVRAFAFQSVGAARAAYESFRPPGAAAFNAGDEGCWSAAGVLFRWGRIVFDVFGNDASFASQGQAAYVAALLEKRMPPGLPESPR